MTAYKVQFFNVAGVLQETTTEASSAREAIDNVLANDENVLRVIRRVIRCKPANL